MNIKLLKDDSKVDPIAAVTKANAEFRKPLAQGLMTKRKYVPEEQKVQRERLKADRELRKWAQEKALPFINPDVFEDFKLVQGLYIIGAVSGQGKSTAAANILKGYLPARTKDKKAYVISNEEMADAILGRVACLELGYSYNRYHKRALARAQLQEVDDLADQLLDYIHVVNNPAYDMSVLEDVQSVMEYAKDTGDVEMMIIDYHQTIERSAENPDTEGFKVQKMLGSYLKDYGRRVAVPVIEMAQLRPDGEGVHFKVRVENDRTLYNHAFAAVEIIPNFETGRTTFKIWKDRFGEVQGKEIEMEYQSGLYVPVGGVSL